MKKISILIALILILAFTVSANAVSVNKIVSKPVLVGELKVLSYLVFTKHKNFSMHDLRELLRNYRGDPSIAFLIRQMNWNSLIGEKHKLPGIKCTHYQYLLKNNKIVKQKAELCKFYFSKYSPRTKEYYHRFVYGFIQRPLIFHERALSNFVKKLLTLNNIYNNINSQGQHYETALYIAVAKMEYRTALVLLTDKNINPNITCLSRSSAYNTLNDTSYFKITPLTALQVLQKSTYMLTSDPFVEKIDTKYVRELVKILEKDKN